VALQRHADLCRACDHIHKGIIRSALDSAIAIHTHATLQAGKPIGWLMLSGARPIERSSDDSNACARNKGAQALASGWSRSSREAPTNKHN
jgi:hypothetical protein